MLHRRRPRLALLVEEAAGGGLGGGGIDRRLGRSGLGLDGMRRLGLLGGDGGSSSAARASAAGMSSEPVGASSTTACSPVGGRSGKIWLAGTRGRAEGLVLQDLDLVISSAVLALQIEVLADRVVEISMGVPG